MHDRVNLEIEGNISDSGDEMSSFGGSGLDSLEWDSECFTQTLDTDMLGINLQNKVWLPDSLKGLSQQPEQEETLSLYGSSQTSRSTSRQSSTEKGMRLIQRLPPSGRSSVERESISSRLSEFSTTSDDYTLISTKPFIRSRQNLGLNLPSSRSSSSSRNGSESLSQLVSDHSHQFNSRNKESLDKEMNTSAYSEESGFVDCEGSMESSISSMNSSIFTTSIHLSPVKEAKEPQTPMETGHSPVK